MDGASERASSAKASPRRDTARMLVTSPGDSVMAPDSREMRETCVAMSSERNMPDRLAAAVDASARYTPTTATRSPGLTWSTRSCSQ